MEIADLSRLNRNDQSSKIHHLAIKQLTYAAHTARQSGSWHNALPYDPIHRSRRDPA
ncbi:hypothetical protein FHW96_000268 [Novosphingobium sp. SG751A]|uniref:hypothetical protein n=1 Tax=Novosphingobium sp. SG751A TaxID=2587000 RepID=UPI0015558463|nr:hypothetical protein [Novosphingobium sp. SG751A]NOW44141.1 hypothetical protein [Novosphingobium sp. SG751A]